MFTSKPNNNSDKREGVNTYLPSSAAGQERYKGVRFHSIPPPSKEAGWCNRRPRTYCGRGGLWTRALEVKTRLIYITFVHNCKRCYIHIYIYIYTYFEVCMYNLSPSDPWSSDIFITCPCFTYVPTCPHVCVCVCTRARASSDPVGVGVLWVCFPFFSLPVRSTIQPQQLLEARRRQGRHPPHGGGHAAAPRRRQALYLPDGRSGERVCVWLLLRSHKVETSTALTAGYIASTGRLMSACSRQPYSCKR